jgi:hypothetical protein
MVFWSILGTSRGQIPHTKRSDRGVQDRRGLEIFEIQPIILGGSPTDPANKTLLTRQQHIGAVRYWNEIVRDLRRNRK